MTEYLFEGWSFHLITVVLMFIALVHFYLNYTYSYWERQGIPSVKGTFPFGNMKDFFLLRSSITRLFCHLTKKIGKEKYFGFYILLFPTLMVTDLDLIKTILIKDFKYFAGRGIYNNENVDVLSGNLFTIDGVKWKTIRGKMAPVFSNQKMKPLYSIIKKCVTDLENFLMTKITKRDAVIECTETTEKYTLDIIANVGLGIEQSCLMEDTQFVKMTFLFTKSNFIQGCRFVFLLLCKQIGHLIRARFSSPTVEKYFIKTVKQVMDYREKHNVQRNDFIQEMIDTNTNKYDALTKSKLQESQLSLTFNDIVAQVFVFIIAGHKTTSSTISLCLYELSLNKNIQEKLRNELDAVESDVTYEQLNELPYLEMVVNETLRKYPILGFLQRECLKDYYLPDGQILKAGTLVIIPLRSIHNDPNYYPNPDEFNPERFNKTSPLHPIVPFSYMPFGDGPRICIGMRFAKLQIKLALFRLLRRFEFEVSPKTKLPLVEDTRNLSFVTKGGIWLQCTERAR